MTVPLGPAAWFSPMSWALGLGFGYARYQLPALEVTLTKLLVFSPKGYQLAGLSVLLAGCGKELKLC